MLPSLLSRRSFLVGLLMAFALWAVSPRFLPFRLALYRFMRSKVKRSMKGGEARKACPKLSLVQVPTRNSKADISLYRCARVRDVTPDVRRAGGKREGKGGWRGESMHRSLCNLRMLFHYCYCVFGYRITIWLLLITVHCWHPINLYHKKIYIYILELGRIFGGGSYERSPVLLCFMGGFRVLNDYITNQYIYNSERAYI